MFEANPTVGDGAHKEVHLFYTTEGCDGMALRPLLTVQWRIESLFAPPVQPGLRGHSSGVLAGAFAGIVEYESKNLRTGSHPSVDSFKDGPGVSCFQAPPPQSPFTLFAHYSSPPPYQLSFIATLT